MTKYSLRLRRQKLQNVDGVAPKNVIESGEHSQLLQCLLLLLTFVCWQSIPFVVVASFFKFSNLLEVRQAFVKQENRIVDQHVDEPQENWRFNIIDVDFRVQRKLFEAFALFRNLP